MLTSKSKAASVLRLDEVDQDDFDLQVKAVACKIAAETKTLGDEFLNYSIIDGQNIFTFSETLLDLLSRILPNLEKSLPAAMIGSIITSIITMKPTMLQVGLGLVANHKPIIEHIHEYRVTSTYHEVRRFKMSSPVSNTESSGLAGFDAKNGLIQVISENFDAHIHTRNGLKQTNGMAIIATQSYSTPPAFLRSPHDRPLIQRLAQQKTKMCPLKRYKCSFLKGLRSHQCQKLFNNLSVASKSFVQTSSSMLPC